MTHLPPVVYILLAAVLGSLISLITRNSFRMAGFLGAMLLGSFCAMVITEDFAYCMLGMWGGGFVGFMIGSVVACYRVERPDPECNFFS